MPAGFTALLRRIILVRQGELVPLLLAFGYNVSLFASYGLLRPVRAEVGTRGELEWLYTYTFLLVLVAQPAYAWLTRRLPRQRFIPLVYAFFCLNLLVFWILWDHPSERVLQLTRYTFFAWLSAFVLFVVSVFWGFMADIFDPDQGRRLFAFIAAGASVGGMLGASLTKQLVEPLGATNLFLLAASFLLLAAVFVSVLARLAGSRGAPTDRSPDQEALGGSLLSGFTRIVESPYLLLVACYILLMTLSSTFLDFFQNDFVKGLSEATATRTEIFAEIDFWASLSTFVLQFFLTARIIRSIGLGPTLAILPLIALGGFTALGCAASLVVIAVFQALNSTGRHAVAKPSREILFTTVPQADKYRAKNVLDTVVYRGGDVLNAHLFRALQGGGWSAPAIAFSVIPIALIWGLVGLSLGRRHGQLVSNGPLARDAR